MNQSGVDLGLFDGLTPQACKVCGGMQLLSGEVDEAVEVAASLDEDSSSNRPPRPSVYCLRNRFGGRRFLKQTPDRDQPGLEEADDHACVCVWQAERRVGHLEGWGLVPL